MAHLAACILADDLTGAGDTGVYFALRGVRTEILLNGDELGAYRPEPGIEGGLPPGEEQAVAVDTASRACLPQEAYRRVQKSAAAALRLEPRLLYKKIDSGLRGNVAAEMRAILDLVPQGLIVFAPAFPQTGRTTVNAIQRVHGVPVTAHEVGRDALTPVRTAHIPQLLAAGAVGEAYSVPRHWIAHLALDDVRRGPAAVADALSAHRQAGRRVIVADAERERDLLALAEALLQAGLSVAAGSGGFAWALAAARRGAPGAPFRGGVPSAARGGILVVSLSMKEVAREQVRRLLQRGGVEDAPFVRVDLHPQRLATASGAPAGDGDRLEVERLAGSVRDALRRTGRVVVTVAEGAPFVSGDGLARALSQLVGRALRPAPAALSAGPSPGVQALVAVGGDTVRALCAGLGCTRVKVEGWELEPGVPLCRLGDGPLAGLPLVMKSGAFGDAQTLVRIVNGLTKGETA